MLGASELVRWWCNTGGSVYVCRWWVATFGAAPDARLMHLVWIQSHILVILSQMAIIS